MKTTVLESDKSYCYYLKDKQKFLWKKVYDDSCDLAEFRGYIDGFIEPAMKTAKKLYFIEQVHKIKSKEEIAKYIRNSCDRAGDMVIYK